MILQHVCSKYYTVYCIVAYLKRIQELLPCHCVQVGGSSLLTCLQTSLPAPVGRNKIVLVLRKSLLRKGSVMFSIKKKTTDSLQSISTALSLSTCDWSAIFLSTCDFSAVLMSSVHTWLVSCITAHLWLVSCITVHLWLVSCITVHLWLVSCINVQCPHVIGQLYYCPPVIGHLYYCPSVIANWSAVLLSTCDWSAVLLSTLKPAEQNEKKHRKWIDNMQKLFFVLPRAYCMWVSLS